MLCQFAGEMSCCRALISVLCVNSIVGVRFITVSHYIAASDTAMNKGEYLLV